jgi:hypothetical protein
MMPELKIVHRSTALAGEEKHFDQMFGSIAKGKEEILGYE